MPIFSQIEIKKSVFITQEVKNKEGKIVLEEKNITDTKAKNGDLFKDLVEGLKKSSEVRSVEVISKQEAYQKFLKDRGSLIELEADESMMPVELKIQLTDPKEADKIVTFVKQEKYQPLDPQPNYEQKVYSRILSGVSYLKKGGLGLSIIFVIISILITLNTIRMAIFSRKKEIEIMRLVGASNYYIKGPFIVEGIFYGSLSTLVCILMLYPILYLTSQPVENFLGGNMFLYFNQHLPYIIIFQLLIGITLGIFSSLLALKKYLKI